MAKHDELKERGGGGLSQGGPGLASGMQGRLSFTVFVTLRRQAITGSLALSATEEGKEEAREGKKKRGRESKPAILNLPSPLNPLGVDWIPPQHPRAPVSSVPCPLPWEWR